MGLCAQHAGMIQGFKGFKSKVFYLGPQVWQRGCGAGRAGFPRLTHLLPAEVRYCGPGQCRHTYASQLLTIGVASVDWIAEQMGHTSANMIRQH